MAKKRRTIVAELKGKSLKVYVKQGEKVKKVNLSTALRKHLAATLKAVRHQIGESVTERDRKLAALPPGKRISRTGRVYYEYRKNRSDIAGRKT